MWATPAVVVYKIKKKDTQSCELDYNRKRRQKRAAYMRQYREPHVLPEKMAKRNEYQRNYRATTVSPAKKAKCNEYQRNYRVQKRNLGASLLNDPSENRERRQEWTDYMRQYRITNVSPEKMAEYNEYQKNYRATTGSPEKNAKRNEYQRNYRAPSLSLECAIAKLHQIVSQGPLYVCTCCYQLWYKHSVTNADQIRQSISGIIKYLNKKSVDSKMWVCRTGHSHLVKNKVPPCAVANGMVFPEKPEFFDLNELECRLLTPRIAFQKLMQAPRGRQLKVHGNIVNIPADVTHTEISKLKHCRSGQKLKKVYCIVADHTESIKLALWEDMIQNVECGKSESYIFKSVIVKISDDTKYLNTNESSTVELQDDIDDIDPTSKEIKDYIFEGLCLGVHVKQATSSIVCNNTVQVVADKDIVTCEWCKTSM
ncbi:hypothetical protein AWC38_SpisGene19638 [Stylophora pistillata]|uniref:DUF6570 domain-containing protein n=1 Tax=Stylophora pistillata TaxID=50429 RepID=A0A2B4RER4_STYPI|nr:hypothetical protein AWC38_SpisGene19638 [Stylophora pistillata]